MELKGNRHIPKTASQIWATLLAPASLNYFREGAHFIYYSFASRHFSIWTNFPIN